MIDSYLRRGTRTWAVRKIYSQDRAVQIETARSHTHRHALPILPKSLHDDAAVLWSGASIRSEIRTIGETPHRRFAHRLGQRLNSPAQMRKGIFKIKINIFNIFYFQYIVYFFNILQFFTLTYNFGLSLLDFLTTNQTSWPYNFLNILYILFQYILYFSIYFIFISK